MTSELDLDEIRSSAEAGFCFTPEPVLALITRLEQVEQDRVKLRNRLDAMRRQRDGYQNQLRKTEQQVARVQEALSEVQTRGEKIRAKGNNGSIYQQERAARGEGYLEATRLAFRALDGEPNE